MDYESIILALIYESGGGISLKNILLTTKLSKAHMSNLKRAAGCLVADNIIIKNKNNKYYIKNKKAIFSAQVVSVSATYGFISDTLSGEEFFVKGSALKGAVTGDTVLARMLKEKTEQHNATAKVITLLEPTDRLFSGIVDKRGGLLRVIPDGGWAEILYADMPLSDADKISDGDKVLFSIIKRGEHHSQHRVFIEKILGSHGTAAASAEAYIEVNGIPAEFPPEVKKQAKYLNDKGIDKGELSSRVDLRDIPIFTIDGADTKDIDDAVYLKKTDSCYELSVHIADVSRYVTERSPLDDEAFLRGTSIYYADRVLPMLPKELSNGICSLNPNEDRLAFSCFMKISFDGVLTDYRFAKSVIRSRVKGVYSEVNALLLGTADDDIKDKYREVADMLPTMRELADILHNRRIERGAPEIASFDTKIICDENGVCVGVKPADRGISEDIIEEFMLAANNAAAKTAMENDLPFVYRVHEPPTKEKLEQLKSTLAELNISCSCSAAADLAALLEKYKDDPLSPLLNRLVLRSMSKARYSEEPIGHFGLVMKEYAHFTSPIRRYSDLAVHRILTEYVAKLPIDKIKKKYTDFAKTASQRASETELRALSAERECDDYYAAEYMSSHISEEYDAMITGILHHGFFAALDNTVEGRVDLSQFGDEEFEYENDITLRGGEHTFTIGDRVRVKCVAANADTGRIDFEYISGHSDKALTDKSEQ